MPSGFTARITGDKQLDRVLADIVSENGAKSIKKEWRKITRDAQKQYVLPEAKARIPTDSGFLESQLVVRALPRSRTTQGHYCGFPDPLFQGETYYGGFLEFGWHHNRSGDFIEGERFLRESLYNNRHAILNMNKQRFAQWAAATNRGA